MRGFHEAFNWLNESPLILAVQPDRFHQNAHSRPAGYIRILSKDTSLNRLYLRVYAPATETLRASVRDVTVTYRTGDLIKLENAIYQRNLTLEDNREPV